MIDFLSVHYPSLPGRIRELKEEAILPHCLPPLSEDGRSPRILGCNGRGSNGTCAVDSEGNVLL